MGLPWWYSRYESACQCKGCCCYVPLVVSNSLKLHGLQPARFLPFMRFSRQEYWSRLPFPPPGNLPNPGIDPASPAAPKLQAESSLLSHWDMDSISGPGRFHVTQRVTKPVCHNYWSLFPESLCFTEEKAPQWESWTLQRRITLTCCN